MGAWYSFSCCSYEWYNYINQQRERKTEVRKNSLQMRIQNQIQAQMQIPIHCDRCIEKNKQLNEIQKLPKTSKNG